MSRIVFASHYALPHLGGIEVVIDALARELGARGHEVVHIASDAVRAEEAGHAAPATEYEVIRVPSANVFEARTGVPWPIFAPRLVPIVRRQVARADVVHAHGLLYLDSLAVLLAARHRDRTVRIVTEHVGHVPYESRILRGVQSAAFATVGRVAARAAQAIVVLNDKVEAEMAALAPRARIVHIPNGVDVERYRPAAPDERAGLRRALGWDETPRLLFVGRLVRKKGVDLAVAAAARLGARARLVVVGPGTLDPALRAPGLEVLGALPPERVAALYRAADAFVLPSRGEGFPLTAQEAMASGLPVVLLDDPAYRPYLGGGSVTAAADAGALAAAIDGLLARRAEAGAAAAAFARARFAWSSAADAHLALYESVRRA